MSSIASSLEPVDAASRTARTFPWRAYFIACLLAGIWINASEIARYFGVVMPMTRETLAMVPGVAPMNWAVFASWGLWDTVLVLATVWNYWLVAERFGPGVRSAVLAGTMSWLLFFVLFWLAMLNMKLGTPLTAAIALPWAWAELVVASLIARRSLSRLAR